MANVKLYKRKAKFRLFIYQKVQKIYIDSIHFRLPLSLLNFELTILLNFIYVSQELIISYASNTTKNVEVYSRTFL